MTGMMEQGVLVKPIDESNQGVAAASWMAGLKFQMLLKKNLKRWNLMMKIMRYLGRRNQIYKYKIGDNSLGLVLWKRVWR